MEYVAAAFVASPFFVLVVSAAVSNYRDRCRCRKTIEMRESWGIL